MPQETGVPGQWRFLPVGVFKRRSGQFLALNHIKQRSAAFVRHFRALEYVVPLGKVMLSELTSSPTGYITSWGDRNVVNQRKVITFHVFHFKDPQQVLQASREFTMEQPPVTYRPCW